MIEYLEQYKRIAIQAPEGLKRVAEDLAADLQSRGKEVFLFADPCYGACDLKDREAEALGAEVLLHMGHKDFGLEKSIPVIFYPYYYDTEVREENVAEISELLGERSFSICHSVNFEKVAQALYSMLEARGKKARSLLCVLGCTFPEIREDVALYVGDGAFHPLGIARKNTSVITFDPLAKKVSEMGAERDRFERKRRGALAGVLGADRIGIIVSTKRGQCRMEEAVKIKRVLEKEGKSAELLVMDRIDAGSLVGYRVDAYINTACPRIATDDGFDKPMINYQEYYDCKEEGS